MNQLLKCAEGGEIQKTSLMQQKLDFNVNTNAREDTISLFSSHKPVNKSKNMKWSQQEKYSIEQWVKISLQQNTFKVMQCIVSLN